MKINVQSNLYTFIYASVMVILVALGLSWTYLKLKPLQEENRLKEKKQAILASIGVYTTRDSAQILFDKYIVDNFVVDANGDKVDGISAFDVELEKEVKKDIKDRLLPVFIAKKDGQTFYIFPVYGKGLWGPIWGYVALEDDLNTVYGVTFDHKGETPGLGAEIAERWFWEQFKGKKIFDENGNFVSIAVVKGADTKNDPHKVDAISGGTMTSKGLEAMLFDCLQAYVNFINKEKAKTGERWAS